jgi:CubicO group peptidase (beta-lactamase class C family)
MDIADAIDAIVTRAMVRQQLPGLSIAVQQRGTTIFARGYGQRNVGEALPADADTIYSIASISKQFTAAALMQQAERGRLRLTDPVSRYFPWHPYGATIDLQHLLTHTSGMPDYFSLEHIDLMACVPATPRAIAESVLDRPAAFAPGAEYQYCNTGYVLLGAILEAVAGQSYATYLQTHIFDPLGMTRTGVDDTPTIRQNVIAGCTSYVLGPWELAREYHPSWEFGTGGLFSTVNDVQRWNRALRSGEVVRPASYAQMTTPMRLTTGHAVNYGLGLGVSTVAGRREIRHTGGLPGISTDNTTYPDDDLDIVVFVNHDGYSTYATIARPILALLLDDPAFEIARSPDFAASSGLDERTEASDWIRAAAAGEIGHPPLAAKFERFLTPARRARFADLATWGRVAAIQRIDATRRDPETTSSYRVDFEHAPLLASMTVRDEGTIAQLNFIRWDDRA